MPRPALSRNLWSGAPSTSTCRRSLATGTAPTSCDPSTNTIAPAARARPLIAAMSERWPVADCTPLNATNQAQIAPICGILGQLMINCPYEQNGSLRGHTTARVALRDGLRVIVRPRTPRGTATVRLRGGLAWLTPPWRDVRPGPAAGPRHGTAAGGSAA